MKVGKLTIPVFFVSATSLPAAGAEPPALRCLRPVPAVRIVHMLRD